MSVSAKTFPIIGTIRWNGISSMAVDGNLQQPFTLYDYPYSAFGGMVCTLWILHSAGFDFGALPVA